MTTRIQVYTTVDIDDSCCLVATDGVYGRYLIYNNEPLDTWSIELMPILMDAITIIRSKKTWTLDDEELKDLVYEVDIESHPEFFI